MPSNDPVSSEETEVDILPSLLNGTPYKIRSNNEKLEIIKKGRPLPHITINKKENTEDSRTLQTTWYSVYKWLCASQFYNKLFCWPCVLMRPETSSWCSTGNDNFKKLTTLASKHATCKSHLKALSEYDETLKSFGLSPKFIEDTKICKEDDFTQSDAESTNFTIDCNSKNLNTSFSKTQTLENEVLNSTSDQNNYKNKQDKVSGKITFKTWQTMYNDLFSVSRAKYLEDHKLYRWKKRLAKQEFRNAKLTGEKLKIEIELLKAKTEFYKTIKSDEQLIES